jgi:hypothetical protein
MAGEVFTLNRCCPEKLPSAVSPSGWRVAAWRLHESNTLHVLWQALPENLRLSQHLYLANSAGAVVDTRLA